jgi:hypothetical protein
MYACPQYPAPEILSLGIRHPLRDKAMADYWRAWEAYWLRAGEHSSALAAAETAAMYESPTLQEGA